MDEKASDVKETIEVKASDVKETIEAEAADVNEAPEVKAADKKEKNKEKKSGRKKVIEVDRERDYVFGLDIGTRNVVGTVGYKDDDDRFHAVAIHSVEHESRAMLDGQIHDIGRVAKTIGKVKDELESQVNFPLSEVCIAAAGRVLRTVTTRVTHEYPEETIVTGEDLNTLDLMGIDQAQRELSDDEDDRYKFYCVGYSVMKYYLNDELFSNLEGHKANKIEEVIIVTFLPQDVVDGLYSAVERVGLTVANMTLEPIAAINVAIPENFRMLNIALVDVGAGTSDICITKEGSIIAYGMIPLAGDELTEVIVQHFLVDFATAEQIKKDAAEQKEVTYVDIMGLTYTVSAKEVWKLTDPVMEKITTDVSEKIKELNGGDSVAATFVVGGGGKVHGFCETLAKKLGIIKERVALRGEEVMREIDFVQKDVKKDPLLVTPIGICLNYFEQKNNFIMIHFNGEMMKLYDNGHLRIVDAAMQAGVPTDDLFPRRGDEINYTINGSARMARGAFGESAKVMMNGEEVGLNTKLIPNCYVTIEGSTEGTDAKLTLDQIDEFKNTTISFIVNGKKITCPNFVEVNGKLESGGYEIREGDVIETKTFYTVGQLAEFMDVIIDENHEIIVNNRVADMDTLVYENFTVDWTEGAFVSAEEITGEDDESVDGGQNDDASEETADSGNEPYRPNTPLKGEVVEALESKLYVPIHVTANGKHITISGQSSYIFSDIFRYIEFDTKAGGNRSVVTTINHQKCGYADPIKEGDVIDIHWEEKA